MPINLRNGSRDTQWETASGSLSLDQINCGSLLRIADATEVMARNHAQLIEERDRFKRWYEDEWKTRARFERKNAALRGRITVLKRQIEKMKGGAA